jgi:hypothetical protein
MSAQELAEYKKQKEKEAELAKRRRHKAEEVKVEKKKEWSVDDYQEVV